MLAAVNVPMLYRTVKEPCLPRTLETVDRCVYIQDTPNQNLSSVI